VRSFQPNLEQGVIAIDGKSSRHTFDQDKKMLHLISAYASESGLVLAQEKIDSTREINAKIMEESRYYIALRLLAPEKALRSRREHWSIENKVHWALNMSLGEYKSRIRKENAPQCMAIIRHIALN
jgi:predicted transposase YbfD/YdcC